MAHELRTGAAVFPTPTQRTIEKGSRGGAEEKSRPNGPPTEIGRKLASPDRALDGKDTIFHKSLRPGFLRMCSGKKD
ncbi:hypothetical protein ZHAS_00002941 [Anopheles sinensis]|uniref:Uncharacterized protein n=1 Tax=Anopheles sinensis TaxID=74873 RepID=A0A084VDB8_ANOSI|nr:hypothetical protein ZHAS_00002941 [Anopheles sinensis]